MRRASRWHRLAWSIVLPLAFGAGDATAQPSAGAAGEGGSSVSFEGPMVLRADELELRSGERAYLARGNVEIEQDGQLLKADRVFFNERTRLGVATGNVEVTEGGDTLQTDFLQFNVDTLRGTVFNGELLAQNAGYTLTGDEIRKTGAKTYTVRDGRFTTCDCPPSSERDPWSIRAGTTDLELDGYAVAKNTRFQVLDVPVLWFPWFFYPLKDKRTTGFLVPEGGRSSRAGFSATVPFFWAVRDNINLTLRPEYQARRGFKPAAELEYVFGQKSYGELYGTFIHDRDIDPDENPDENFDRDRWGVTWEHLQDLPAGLRLHVDAIGASDNNVPFDFNDFTRGRRERFLHTRSFVESRFGPGKRFVANTGVQFSDDLQSPDRDDRDDFLLQRLPELRLSALTGGVPGLPGLFVGGNVEYAYFQPFRDPDNLFADGLIVDDQFYDTGADAIPTGQERNRDGVRQATDIARDDGVSEGDGVFQEGEPLADRGHRVLVNPRLSYPLHWEFLHFVPEVSYHGTFYDTRLQGTETRHLLTAKADFRTELSGELTLPLVGTETLHILEPHVGYAFVTDEGQNDNPLLVPRTSVPQVRLRHLERDNLVRDGADRITEVNSVFVGIHNRFLDPASRRQIGSVGLSAEYGIEDNEFPSAVVQGEARPGGGVNTRFHAVYEPETKKVSEGLFHIGWSSTAGHTISLRYRYVRDIPRVFEDFVFDNDRFDDFEDDFRRISQVSGGFYIKASDRWAFTYSGNYSFENALSLRNLAGIEYTSACRCWAFRFEASHDRQRGFDFGFRYRLLGLGDPNQRPFAGSGNNPFARR